MPVNNETTLVDLSGVVAGNPYVVGMALLDSSHLVVTYGTSQVDAIEGTHYAVALDEGTSFTDFTWTPTAALLTAITALGEGNHVRLVRVLPGTTDFNATDAFIRDRIADEFARASMRHQQIANNLGSAAELDIIVSTADPSGAAAENTLWLKYIP